MPRSPSRRTLASFLLVACTVTAGCSAWRPWHAADRPWTAETFHRAEAARLKLADGSTLELVAPEFVQHGADARLSGRVAGSAPDAAPREVDLGQVTGLEVRKLDGDRMVGNLLAGAVLVLVVLLVVAIAAVAISGGVPVGAA